MKKFMNTAETMVAESVEGFVRAHEALVVFGPERRCIRRRHPTAGKVALISGGGAGHEPMHIGFVGHGMLDAACVGHIFTSPTPSQIIAAIEEADTGAGCLLVVKNYDGDLMNFEMAIEMAGDRHNIDMVVVSDDIETSRSGEGNGRRGVAGTLIVEKLLGAAAERGMSLAELKQLGEGLNTRIRSMGVALNGVTVPQTERTTFSLGPGEMEMGVGIHGEPGHASSPSPPPTRSSAISAKPSPATSRWRRVPGHCSSSTASAARRRPNSTLPITAPAALSSNAAFRSNARLWEPTSPRSTCKVCRSPLPC